MMNQLFLKTITVLLICFSTYLHADINGLNCIEVAVIDGIVVGDVEGEPTCIGFQTSKPVCPDGTQQMEEPFFYSFPWLEGDFCHIVVKCCKRSQPRQPIIPRHYKLKLD